MPYIHNGQVAYANLLEFLSDLQPSGLLYAELVTSHRFYLHSSDIFTQSLRFHCTCGLRYRLIRCDAADFPAWAVGASWVLESVPAATTATCSQPRSPGFQASRLMQLLLSHACYELFDIRYGDVFSWLTNETPARPDLWPLADETKRELDSEDHEFIRDRVLAYLGMNTDDDRSSVFTPYFHPDKVDMQWRTLFLKILNGRVHRSVVNSQAPPSFDPAGIEAASDVGLDLPIMATRRLKHELFIRTMSESPQALVLEPADIRIYNYTENNAEGMATPRQVLPWSVDASHLVPAPPVELAYYQEIALPAAAAAASPLAFSRKKSKKKANIFAATKKKRRAGESPRYSPLAFTALPSGEVRCPSAALCSQQTCLVY